ncbi:hypothetical protein ACVILK_004324 [Bradyrhizobium embrapense]
MNKSPQPKVGRISAKSNYARLSVAVLRTFFADFGTGALFGFGFILRIRLKSSSRAGESGATHRKDSVSAFSQPVFYVG